MRNNLQEQLYHPVRICDDCFQKLYPEEAAKKLQEATNETGAHAGMNVVNKHNDAIEMNLHEKSNVKESNITHQYDGPTTNTSQNGCKVRDANNEIDENKSRQNDSNGVLPNRDIKNVVPTNDTTNEVLEGEACVVLNDNSSDQS